MNNKIKKACADRLCKYLILSFGITWLLWWGEAVLLKVTDLKVEDLVPTILFTIGGFGPTLAACFCLEGGFSWKKLWKFLTTYKSGNLWYLSLFIVLEITLFILSSSSKIESFPKTPATIVFLLLMTTLLYGGNEELGWRGTMQDLVINKFGRLFSPFVIGLVWVTWHIPLWFIEGDSHQAMSFLTFALLGIALSYWLSSIYDVTGSVLACMLCHGVTNALLGIFNIAHDFPFIMGSVLLTVVAIFASFKSNK